MPVQGCWLIQTKPQVSTANNMTNSFGSHLAQQMRDECEQSYTDFQRDRQPSYVPPFSFLIRVAMQAASKADASGSVVTRAKRSGRSSRQKK